MYLDNEVTLYFAVQDTESVSDDDYSDDDNLPDDFPVVCPYFKSPPLKTALAEK